MDCYYLEDCFQLLKEFWDKDLELLYSGSLLIYQVEQRSVISIFLVLF